MIAFEFKHDDTANISLRANWYDEGKCFSHSMVIDGTAQGWDVAQYTFRHLSEVMYLRNALDAYIAACQKVNLFEWEDFEELEADEEN